MWLWRIVHSVKLTRFQYSREDRVLCSIGNVTLTRRIIFFKKIIYNQVLYILKVLFFFLNFLPSSTINDSMDDYKLSVDFVQLEAVIEIPPT